MTNVRENLKKWIPNEDIVAMYDLIDFGFDEFTGDFFVIVEPEFEESDSKSETCVKISWKNIIANMISSESYRADIWIGPNDEKWSFFTSTSSDFFKFCCNEKKSAHLDLKDVIQYSFILKNWVIDVISNSPPKIIFIK